MTDEKRIVCGLEVHYAMHIGDREILLLLDTESKDMPFVVGYRTVMPDLGLEQLTELVGGDDFLEAAEEFLRRAQAQVTQIQSDRELSGLPQELFGPGQCLPGGMEQNLVGCVVVIKPEVLRFEYWNVAQQLVYVTGGFGAAPNSRGTAVFGKNVFSGIDSNWRRSDVQGVLNPIFAPEWVKPGVAAIQAQRKAKDSKPKDRGDRG